MPTLQTTIGGQPKGIEFTSKITKGIYHVDENQKVAANCKTLDITTGKGTDTMIEHKVSKFNTLTVITLSGVGLQKQYLVFSSASYNDIDQYMNHLPKDVIAVLKSKGLNNESSYIKGKRLVLCIT